MAHLELRHSTVLETAVQVEKNLYDVGWKPEDVDPDPWASISLEWGKPGLHGQQKQ